MKSVLYSLLFFAAFADGAITYTYDAAGRLTQANYGNGTVITYSYDPAGNLLNRSVQTPSYPAFFNGQDPLGSGVYYLQFPNGNLFGYYNLTNFPIFYHYDMGFEAFIDGGNGQAYLFDFASGHWWYTSASLFPYLYDFTLNTFIYYFPDPMNAGHYSTNPRYFSNLTTGKIIMM
jgi:YD repeat-containing protein